MSGKESSRVLVIDDDDLVLAIIRKMLDAELFSVDGLGFGPRGSGPSCRKPAMTPSSATCGCRG